MALRLFGHQAPHELSVRGKTSLVMDERHPSLHQYPEKGRKTARRIAAGLILLCSSHLPVNATPDFQIQATPNPTGAPAFAYPASAPPSVTITPDGDACATTCQWVDFRGNALSPPITIDKRPRTLLPPSGARPGYLGLRCDNRCADLDPLETGFALLPATLGPPTDERFGVVHADIDDPLIGPGVKTLTWNTLPASAWAQAMATRTRLGKRELPLIDGEGWDSDDRRPVSKRFLDRMAGRFAQYLQAWPAARDWELGLEENLTPRYRQRHYWPNLIRKARALRKTAQQAGHDIRLIYQIAELNLDDIRKFIDSGAAAEFDILSLHPYAWPDFPDPDAWLGSYLRNVRSLLEKAGLDLPLWFTEAGAPHRNRLPDHRFTDPESGAHSTGLSRRQAVINLIKTHVIALQEGVQRIYWYNYRDQHAGENDVENHFGLIDFRGHPKPVYSAYLQMISLLDHARPLGSLGLGKPRHAWRFQSGEGQIIVAWTTAPAPTAAIDITQLGIPTGKRIIVIDPMGNASALDGRQLLLGPEPQYLFIPDSR